jgi:hypothetical protein
MSNVKYYFLGDTSLARTNVITIAYELETAVGGDLSLIPVVKFGVAFSSTIDVYSKKIGKRIATNRMKTEPRRECMLASNFQSVQNAILKNILNNAAPTWAYDVVSYEIDFAYREIRNFFANGPTTDNYVNPSKRTPPIIEENWWGAVSYAKEYRKDGWRLPLAGELINRNLVKSYWSCTQIDYNNAKFVSNGLAYIGDKGDVHNVILVRA